MGEITAFHRNRERFRGIALIVHYLLMFFHAIFHKEPEADPLLVMHGEDHIRGRKHFKDAICQSGYPTNDL